MFQFDLIWFFVFSISVFFLIILFHNDTIPIRFAVGKKEERYIADNRFHINANWYYVFVHNHIDWIITDWLGDLIRE